MKQPWKSVSWYHNILSHCCVHRLLLLSSLSWLATSSDLPATTPTLQWVIKEAFWIFWYGMFFPLYLLSMLSIDIELCLGADGRWHGGGSDRQQRLYWTGEDLFLAYTLEAVRSGFTRHFRCQHAKHTSMRTWRMKRRQWCSSPGRGRVAMTSTELNC